MKSFLRTLFLSTLGVISPKYCQATAPIGAIEKSTAEALVLSCVDYRLNDTIAELLKKDGLAGKYDLIALAGGSLSVINDYFPFARDTFWAHLALLKNLHHFKKVIIIDHRDCGMYEFVYGRNLSENPKEELDLHKQHVDKVKKLIIEKYPDLKVETWLISLNGDVEKTMLD